MDIASIASAASEMKAAETQYAANIKVMKMALDSQKAGLSLLSPLDVSANVNRASEGAAKGSMVDILA
ncbi:putative motility protein [Seleniivibrio woodruffii]|uniref:Putative motility protein YjfB-like n=1 Tax=Seleniivibrio woodruffii TaxID=1078050 RepID=A0A4R1KC13_9BACT|nr:putative motility protein [Seleniivibrio woodruffii]TCK62014.1 putative motility protein YjfB-like [Seleniivibrio woodruffii]TVZ34869.1 putative motility protein YjfB-like [Seleniivibrio woodruffii]